MRQPELIERDMEEIERYADWLHTVHPEIIAHLCDKHGFYDEDSAYVYSRRACAEIAYHFQHGKKPRWSAIFKWIDHDEKGRIKLIYYRRIKAGASTVWFRSEWEH